MGVCAHVHRFLCFGNCQSNASSTILLVCVRVCMFVIRWLRWCDSVGFSSIRMNHFSLLQGRLCAMATQLVHSIENPCFCLWLECVHKSITLWVLHGKLRMVSIRFGYTQVFAYVSILARAKITMVLVLCFWQSVKSILNKRPVEFQSAHRTISTARDFYSHGTRESCMRFVCPAPQSDWQKSETIQFFLLFLVEHKQMPAIAWFQHINDLSVGMKK